MVNCKKLEEAKVVSLGDPIDDDELTNLQKDAPLGVAVVKVIYWYESCCYDGNGTVVYQDSHYKWHIDGLWHCSCYGPCHDGFSKITYSLDEIKKLLKKEDYYEYGGKEILDYLENVRPKEDNNE